MADCATDLLLVSGQVVPFCSLSRRDQVRYCYGTPIFTVETNPAPQDLQFLADQINEHNMVVTGYYDFQPLAIFVRDAAQSMVAGLSGYTWGHSCKIEWLWVASALRGQGYGKALLQAAEAEAQQRGCHVVVVDTHSFQAPAFYQKLGYTMMGSYTDFPYQHGQIFLQKRLH